MSTITMDNISVMSAQYVHHTFDYYLDSMVRCGVKNIDIWGGTPHFCRFDYPTSAAAGRKLRELRDKIDSRGLKVAIYTPEILGYPFNLAVPDQMTRDRTVDYMDMAMDDALELGTNRLFINSDTSPADLPHEESWARCADTIGRICELAEKKGITMMLETLQPYESNLVVTLNDLERMLHDVNSPALQVCLDVVAMEVSKETMRDWFDRLGGHIQFVHYADGDPSGHYILGDGKLPLKEYISIMEQNNYSGIVDLEINDSIYWDDPHTSVKRSVDYLRTFLPEK